MNAHVRRPRNLRSITLRTAPALVTLVLAATACGGSGSHVGTGNPHPATSPGATTPGTTNTGTATPSSPSPTVSTPPAAATCADRFFSGMTQAQRIGQLFMGGISAAHPDQTQLRTLSADHVGSIMLTGRSAAGTAATRKIVDSIQGQADQVAGKRARLFISTDQEGGRVQVLSGPGFSTMPSGLTQGTWSTTTLRTNAATWAGQLKVAGVNLNLAPVADVVPAGLGTRNGPIGAYNREFGHTPDIVTSHSNAFAAGFAQAGVLTTLKHFPGLGQVIGNTDTTANVVDSVTTSTSLTPFRSGISAGSPFVMVSLATYSKIDSKHLAAFSPTVIGQLLRTQLGFKGVVISDDLGNAVAVRSFTPAQRAVDFITAGGNMILTVQPGTVPSMARAIKTRMLQDPSFRAKVNDSVRHILNAKAGAGLLTCS